MRLRRHSYHHLDGLTWERDSIPWHWRFLALAASWMVLGGYLVFSAGYENDAQLRFSAPVLYVFVVILLLAGYGLGALLCILCRSLVFQAESIFVPTLASSAIGLLHLFWKFMSSSGYTWNASAIVSLVLSLLACLLYGSLFYVWHQKLARLRTQQDRPRSLKSPAPSAATDNHSLQPATTPTRSIHPSTGDRRSQDQEPSRSQSESAEPSQSEPWQSSSFYANYNANMHPSALHTPRSAPILTEDDLVNQQMARLLARSENGRAANSGHNSTFRIDLPQGSRPGTSDGVGLQRSETLEEYFNRNGPRMVAHPEYAQELATSHTDRDPRALSWQQQPAGQAQIRRRSSSQTQAGPEAVRPGARPGIVRAKSREDRRMEIEMDSMRHP